MSEQRSPDQQGCRARPDLRRPVHGRARHRDRERRAAVDPATTSDVGQSTLQWVVIAYGLLLGGFLMFGGRLADLLGRRRILVAGLAIFSAASLLAGLSQIGELADHRPRAAGIRRRADRADRAVDPRRHVRRGAGAQPCARDLRRRGRDVGVDRRDRQRPADRRARAGAGCSSSTCRSACC